MNTDKKGILQIQGCRSSLMSISFYSVPSVSSCSILFPFRPDSTGDIRDNRGMNTGRNRTFQVSCPVLNISVLSVSSCSIPTNFAPLLHSSQAPLPSPAVAKERGSSFQVQSAECKVKNARPFVPKGRLNRAAHFSRPYGRPSSPILHSALLTIHYFTVHSALLTINY